MKANFNLNETRVLTDEELGKMKGGRLDACMGGCREGCKEACKPGNKEGTKDEVLTRSN